jgi:hypothetical protein
MAFPEDRDRQLQRQAHDTLQLADELIDWLGEYNPQRRAARQSPIAAEEEFQLLSLRRTAASLSRSSQVPTAVAVYGPSQVGKSLFVGRVLEPQDPQMSPLGPDEGRGAPVYYPGLSFEFDVNPRCASQEATAIVTRFTTKDRFEPSVHPDFPVLVRGLSRSEWLRVLARGFRSECELDKNLSFREAELETLLEDVAARYPAESVDRNWRMDLLDAYAYLKRLDPLRYHADEATANGLLSRYPLAEAGYLEVAARLCWGGWPELTELFTGICRFLDKIGRQGREGMLVHWAAVRFLLDSQQRLEHTSPQSRHFPIVKWSDIVTREVDGWYTLDYAPGEGPPADPLPLIQSAMLEMVIPVLPHRLNSIWREVLENIDFLDIPGLIAGGQGDEGAVNRRARGFDAQAGASIVKRGKVFYLFERYIDELQAQTLLLLVRGGSLGVRGYLKEYVDKWGRARYGKDHWPQRIKDPSPALFLGLTGIDEEFLNETPTPAVYDARLKLLVDETFKDWMTDFGGPGQAFTNIFPLRYPGTWDWNAARRQKALASRSVSADHWTEAGRAFATSSWVQKFVGGASRKWEAAMRDGDGGTSLLAAGFRQATSSVRKQDELARNLEETRTALARLAQSWAVDPDVNLDRNRRQALAGEVLDWLRSEPDVLHFRVQALEAALCFRGGDVLPIADFADVGSAGRPSLQSVDKRFPGALLAFLRDWGTHWAPQRWQAHTAARHDLGRWLAPDRFDAFSRYLVDYLTSNEVFEHLCGSLLEVVQLTISNKADRRHARRRFVRLVLNDYVMTPGDRLHPDSVAADGAPASAFGLMTSLVRRWEERLPQVLAAGAGRKMQIPAGNDRLIEILGRYEG